jgi:hypothetical protein
MEREISARIVSVSASVILLAGWNATRVLVG